MGGFGPGFGPGFDILVSEGSFTIGVGGDYATLNTFRANIDAGGLTAALSATVISDFTENVADDTTFIPLNGFALTIDSDQVHGGKLGVGNIISLEDQISFRVSGTGSLEVKNTQCVFGSGAVFISLNLATSGPTLLAHDNITDADGTAQAMIFQFVNTGGVMSVYNNMHARTTYSGNANNFNILSAGNPLLVFNNTSESLNAGFVDGFQLEYHTQPNAVNIANNIAIVSAGNEGFKYTGTDSGLIAANYMHNNATTDSTTLAGSTLPIQDFIPDDEFGSLDPTSSDFLVPRTGSQFALGGTSVNNPATADMTGATYGASPPIGVYIATATPLSLINLFFRMFQHLWPISIAFDTTKEDKQFTELNKGLSGIGVEVKTFTDNVYGDIFPETTRELTAWETQWNLPENTTLTEQERRDRLTNAWSSLGGQSPKYIQDTIQGAGFTTVFLHEWWDLAQLPLAVAHDPNVILAGDEDLLVNIITFTEKDFITGLGEVIMECGEADALCGQYTQFLFKEVEYLIPTNPELYPYFLYFGDATFPNRTTVPLDRKEEFRELLLKICPAQQWLGLLIDFV